MKKRVLVISVGVVPPAVMIGGMAAVRHLVERLVRDDAFEVHTLSALPPEVDAEFEGEKFTAHFVRTTNPLLMRLLFFFQALSLHREYRFDLIHDYSSSPLLVGLTGILGKLCGCRTLHTLCVVNEGFLGSEKLAVGFNWVDEVIVTAPNLLSSKKGVKYLPLGVDTGKFQPRPKDFEKTVLFLGSLTERKGAAVLMRAAKKVVKNHPDAKFIFASYGKGEHDPDYHRNRDKLQKIGVGLEKNIQFLEGALDVPQLMSSADIFVLPAISLHGTISPPITLMEAMSSGKPCIVSDVCRGDGLVEDGVNCLLFQSGNVGDLSDKINLLLSNRALREKLGKNARQKIADQFDIRKIARELSKMYLTKFDNSQN